MNKTIFEYNVERPIRGSDRSSFAFLHFVATKISARLKVFVSDVVALSIAFLCASVIYYVFSNPESRMIGIDAIFQTQILGRYMLFFPILIFVFLYGGLYSRNFWEGRELQRIVQGVALLALFDGALIATGQSHNASVWMLAVWPIAALSVFVCRMALRIVPFGFPAEVQNVLLVGGGITPEEFRRESRESRCGPVRVLQGLPLEMMAGLGRDGIEYRIKIVADRFGIPPAQIRIVLVPTREELDLAQLLVTALNTLRRPFSMMLPFRGLARSGLSLHQAIGADFVLAELDARPTDHIGQVLKRGTDLLISILALVLLAPLLVMIAVMLKLEGGPIFFVQSRVGKNGRQFGCLKFRSMRVDAEEQLSHLLASDPVAGEEWKRHQKLANDPRITRFGAFLRATSLDELPQFLCVVVGDMSVVGPRPIIAPEISGYENDRTYFEGKDFAHYASCKPGITGLWQVSGRARTMYQERVRLDSWYCRNWSMWLDVMIILKTIRAVLVRSGS